MRRPAHRAGPRLRARGCAGLKRPPWWRQGRAELRPHATTPSSVSTGRVVPNTASKARHGRVNRAGTVYGDVVVPWDYKQGSGETVEHGLRLFELGRAATVREVAACDDERRRQLEAGCHQRVVHIGLAVDAAMEVGDMDCACGHRRVRLYTRSMSDQSPEIFDDVYLGLQAGGALRKQRRGEELTEQEEAALGHWQRLSLWRKAFAIGAFAIGTFGLGFTLGGLIFGRRRARA